MDYSTAVLQPRMDGFVGYEFLQRMRCYGLNVQATCDAFCRFTSLSVICPGGTSDSKSFYASNVYNLVSQSQMASLLLVTMHIHCHTPS